MHKVAICVLLSNFAGAKREAQRLPEEGGVRKIVVQMVALEEEMARSRAPPKGNSAPTKNGGRGPRSSSKARERGNRASSPSNSDASGNSGGRRSGNKRAVSAGRAGRGSSGRAVLECSDCWSGADEASKEFHLNKISRDLWDIAHEGEETGSATTSVARSKHSGATATVGRLDKDLFAAANRFFTLRREFRRCWLNAFGHLDPSADSLQEDVDWDELVVELEELEFTSATKSKVDRNGLLKFAVDDQPLGDREAEGVSQKKKKREPAIQYNTYLLNPLSKGIETGCHFLEVLALKHNTAVKLLNAVTISFAALRRRDIITHCTALREGLTTVDQYCTIVARFTDTETGSEQPDSMAESFATSPSFYGAAGGGGGGFPDIYPSFYGWARQEKRVQCSLILGLSKLLWGLWGRANVLFYNVLWSEHLSLAPEDFWVVTQALPGPGARTGVSPPETPQQPAVSPVPVDVKKSSGGAVGRFFSKLLSKKSVAPTLEPPAPPPLPMVPLTTVMPASPWTQILYPKLQTNCSPVLAHAVTQLLSIGCTAEYHPTLVVLYDSAVHPTDAKPAETEASSATAEKRAETEKEETKQEEEAPEELQDGTVHDDRYLFCYESKFHLSGFDEQETATTAPATATATAVANAAGGETVASSSSATVTSGSTAADGNPAAPAGTEQTSVANQQKRKRRPRTAAGGGGVGDWVISSSIPFEIDAVLHERLYQEVVVMSAMFINKMVFEDLDFLAESTAKQLFFYQRGGKKIDGGRTHFLLLVPVPEPHYTSQGQVDAYSPQAREAEAKKLMLSLQASVKLGLQTLQSAWLLTEFVTAFAALT